MAFGGDVHFEKKTRRLLAEPHTAFGSFARVLRSADFSMVNLETAVTERGVPEDKKFCFRAPVSTYDALHEAGISLISLANNHTLDYGRVGLTDTLNSAQAAGMPYVGAGRDAQEAFAPHRTTVNGVRLAVFGFSQIRALAESWKATDSRPGVAMAHDTQRAVAAVKSVRPDVDVVVVYLHWGREGDIRPKKDMRAFADLMAEAGVDVIVGTHAHVVLGHGWLKNTYVHWGLGNFIWYGPSHSTDTGVLLLTVRGRRVIRVKWCAGVVSETGQPVPLTGSEIEAQRQRLRAAATCSRLARQPAGWRAIMLR